MTMILLLAYAFGAVYIPIISVLCIPFLVLCLYFPYRLVKHCCVQTICKNKTERNTANEPPPEEQAPFIVPVTPVSVDDYIADDLYADRMLNPDKYNEQ